MNDRWDSIDILPYLLTYFLHPAHRGKYSLSKDFKTKEIEINFHLFRCRIEVINMEYFNNLRRKNLLVYVKEES